MKKLLGILMILILIAGVFVSCSQDKIEEAVISGEELLDVSFGASSGRARDLVVDTPVFNDGDYVWYYTAKKADSTGFKTGETLVKTPVKDPAAAQSVADRKGLSGAVISGLSQGYWDFGLYAYVPDTSKPVDYDYTVDYIAWQGSVSHFLLVKGAANVVDVTVSPSTQGKGWLVVDVAHIYIKDGSGALPKPVTDHPGTSLVYTVTPFGGTTPVDISEPIDAGAYLVKVVCTGSNIDYAEDSIVVNVYSGLTRTVSGWIGELTTSAVFGEITGEIIEASTGSKSAQELKDLGDQSVDFVSKGTVPVTASLPATAAVALLPEVEPGTDQDLTLTLNVKADAESTEQEVTTKSYDITLVQKLVETTGGSSTTTVSDVEDLLTKYLTATLTIDKNLSDVSVKHSNTLMLDLDDDPTPTEADDEAAGYPGFFRYDAATDVLTLMTRRFSPFEVTYTKPVSGIASVTRIVGELETTVADCKSLDDAFDLAIDGDIVLVLENTSLGSTKTVSKEIVIRAVDKIKDVTDPLALAGRGYEGTYDSEHKALTITKTPITDAVARIDDLYFKTIQTAIDSALDGDTVYLLCDENLLEVEANGKVLINKSITFDGNGYTISRKGESHLPGFALHVNGSEDNYINVVIQNLKIDTERSHGVIFNTYIDQAVMTDCSIDTKYRTPIYTGDDEPVSSVRKVILNNVSATMHEPEDRSYPWNNTALAVTYGATVIVNGGTYTAPISTYIMSSGGSLTIDGDAEFVATGNSTYSLDGIRLDRNYWEGSWNCDSILTIKDGSFDFTQATAPGINLWNSGDVAHVGWNDQVKLVIEGGTFIGFAVNGVDDNWCIATITGGTFDHDPSAYVPYTYDVEYYDGLYHVVPCTHVYDVFNMTTRAHYLLDSNGMLTDLDHQPVDASGLKTVGLLLLDSTKSNLVADAIDNFNSDYLWYAIHPSTEVEDKTNFAGGYGTKIEPYLIETLPQMQAISDKYDGDYAYYKVKNPAQIYDASDWTAVNINGSFNGNGALFQALNVQLFRSVGTAPSEAVYKIKNLTVNADIRINGYGAALIRQAGNNLTLEDITVHGYIEGNNGAASFVCFGPGNITTAGSDDHETMDWKFIRCISDATICATGDQAVGFIKHPYSYASQQGGSAEAQASCLITVEDSLFTGTIYYAGNSQYAYKYFVGNANDVLVKTSYSNAFISQYGNPEGVKYAAPAAKVDGKFFIGNYPGEGTKISGYSAYGTVVDRYLGEHYKTDVTPGVLPEKYAAFSIQKTEGAVSAKAVLEIAPNGPDGKGAYLGTFMGEDIEVLSTQETIETSLVKYFDIDVNAPGVTAQGLDPNGKTYHVYNPTSYGDTYSSAGVRVTQYASNGDVLSITYFAFPNSN